jgi:hypothetical protein
MQWKYGIGMIGWMTDASSLCERAVFIGPGAGNDGEWPRFRPKETEIFDHDAFAVARLIHAPNDC